MSNGVPLNMTEIIQFSDLKYRNTFTNGAV